LKRLDISFSDIRLTVEKTGQEILKGITGHAQCGEVLALMGATGSGKTSLLTTLAHRNEAGLASSGSIRYGSEHCVVFSKALKPKIGFVEQDDVVIAELTVRQSLSYSAALRLGRSLSRSEQQARVKQVISQLRLDKCSDTVVGSADARGISGGERKRLCIATELLTKPRLLFLDEPTSGLDSSTAEIVVKVLKSLAQDDQVTVVCSIHQPSSQIYHLFDRLCFMDDGRCVYMGPGGATSVENFAKAGMQCPVHFNPPDYFMELATSGKFGDSELAARLSEAVVPSEIERRALAAHADRREVCRLVFDND
jgi:ABC-type multidrug transport system ATPase subunit